ncbi:hypothetical protein Tco_0603339 [Tanacetum coccineum]
MRRLPRANFNNGELTRENLTNLILKYNGKRVALKLNTHDFYAMGFVANDGTLWEFRLETDVARLRGSRAVGIKLNYPPLVGLTVSKETLKNAFSDLARMVQAMECEEEDIVLTDAVKGVVVDRDYSFFCQSGNEQRISQARIAKLLIKVVHLPQENL